MCDHEYTSLEGRTATGRLVLLPNSDGRWKLSVEAVGEGGGGEGSRREGGEGAGGAGTEGEGANDARVEAIDTALRDGGSVLCRVRFHGEGTNSSWRACLAERGTSNGARRL